MKKIKLDSKQLVIKIERISNLQETSNPSHDQRVWETQGCGTELTSLLHPTYFGCSTLGCTAFNLDE